MSTRVKKETELRVVTPNEPGIFGRVMGTLANAGVNLKAMSVSSDQEQGIFLLITSDPKKAEKCLKALGYKVTSNPVVTILIEDRIGSGAEIGALLGNAVVNVDYCYGSSSGLGHALLVICPDHLQKTYDTLK